jgi:hypothetical protein
MTQQDLMVGDKPLTQEGRKRKDNNERNGAKLTDKQLRAGSLKGRTSYYSKDLKCTFYVKKGVDPLEVEQRYINERAKI